MTLTTNRLRFAADLLDELASDPDFTNEERAHALHLADKARDIAAQQAKDLRLEQYRCHRDAAA